MNVNDEFQAIRVGEVPEHADPATQRTARTVGEILTSMWSAMEHSDVTYAEYDAAKAWLIAVGEAGEWPLFLDVFFEHVVEKQAAKKTSAGESAIQGPFYISDSPLLEWSGSVPMRDSEPGTRLRVKGRVVDSDGTPLAGAIVDHWQADADGFYSNFHPEPPQGNLRARFRTNDAGEFEIRTVVPAPYMIPHDGPTGALLKASGWHPWRPAHLHYFVSAPGYDRLTTQLFIPGDPWLGVDCASADKPTLVVEMDEVEGSHDVDYDFVLQKSTVGR